MKSISVLLRDQSVFIIWGGSEEFRGVHSKFGCQRGGGGTHLKILSRGVQKIHTVQLNLQYIFLTLVNIILQKHDCIATKIQSNDFSH